MTITTEGMRIMRQQAGRGNRGPALVRGEITEERIRIFEALCDASDNHPMTVIFTAYDRMMGGPETDPDISTHLTDIAQDLFDVDDRDIVDQLSIRWDNTDNTDEEIS